eukprot:6481603-Prymnesium_polylepis.1
MDGCGSTPWRPHHPGATAVVVREGAWHRSQWLGRPAAHTSSCEKRMNTLRKMGGTRDNGRNRCELISLAL